MFSAVFFGVLLLFMIVGLLSPKKKETQVNNQLNFSNMANTKWFLVIDKTGQVQPLRITQEQIKQIDDAKDWLDKELHKWSDEAVPNDRWEDTKTLILRLHR